MEQYNLLDVIGKLTEDKTLQAEKEVHGGICTIRWVERKSANGMDQLSQLVHINTQGAYNFSILTDDMFDFNSQAEWTLVPARPRKLFYNEPKEAQTAQ